MDQPEKDQEQQAREKRESSRSHTEGVCWCGEQHPAHQQQGACWCGEEHKDAPLRL